jgi:hypothetical protein
MEGNIKVDIKGIGYGVMDLIHTYYRDQWHVLVNSVMNPQFSL